MMATLKIFNAYFIGKRGMRKWARNNIKLMAENFP